MMYNRDKALLGLQRSISLELPVIDNQFVDTGFLTGYMNRKNECFFVGFIFFVNLLIRRSAAFVPGRRRRQLTDRENRLYGLSIFPCNRIIHSKRILRICYSVICS